MCPVLCHDLILLPISHTQAGSAPAHPYSMPTSEPQAAGQSWENRQEAGNPLGTVHRVGHKCHMCPHFPVPHMP